MSRILIGVAAFAFAVAAAHAGDKASAAAGAAQRPAQHARLAPMPGAGMRAGAKTLVNAGFEQAGAAPLKIPGWTLAQHAGAPAYEMDVDKSTAAEGHASFRMHRTQVQEYGTISQTLDVSALAGKKVELRARVKVDGVGKRGWVVFVDSSGSRATKGVSGTADWKEIVVTMQLPKSAKTATVGAMLLDAGTAWLDDVSVKPL